MLPSMDCQRSEMSPVVRQLFPTAGAHRAGSSTPHSMIEVREVMTHDDEKMNADTNHTSRRRSLDHSHSEHHASPDIASQESTRPSCSCHTSDSPLATLRTCSRLSLRSRAKPVDQRTSCIQHLRKTRAIVIERGEKGDEQT